MHLRGVLMTSRESPVRQLEGMVMLAGDSRLVPGPLNPRVVVVLAFCVDHC